MTRVKPNRDDLVGQLHKQHGFLGRSMRLLVNDRVYDEAARVAVSLRVLIRQTSSSHALLQQLGLLDAMRFPDTAFAPPSDEPGTLTLHGQQPGLVRLVMTPVPHYIAPLDQVPIVSWLDCAAWWKSPAIATHAGGRLSRRDLVLGLANQDGGAHVDPNGLTEDQHSLQLAGVGFLFSVNADFPAQQIDPDDLRPAEGDAAALSIAQVAWEYSTACANDPAVMELLAPSAGSP